MKKIINLTHVKRLSKEQQQEITGANFNRPYCGPPGQCCVNLPNGGRFCDYGYCLSNGCMWA